MPCEWRAGWGRREKTGRLRMGGDGRDGRGGKGRSEEGRQVKGRVE